MQAEGESGRKKINQYTRFLTIAITLVQAPGYIATSVAGVPGAVANPSTFWWFSAVLILVCSTLVIMWLGERITDKGVGNGISLLIMIGIIATFPQAIIQEFIHGHIGVLFLVDCSVDCYRASVALVQALRKVPIQMAKTQAGGTHTRRGRTQLHSLKVNSAGVMPIIFAQAIMFVPLYLTQSETFQDNAALQSLPDFNGFWYNLISS